MLEVSAIEAGPRRGKSKLATRIRKPTARSRVGNGKMLMAGVDRRGLSYREYQDTVADLVHHLGGEPTAVELAIAEEASGLIVWCRQARVALLKGEEFNIQAYTTGVNALRRLLVDIGQERRLRDVTPSLEAIVARHAAAGTARTTATNIEIEGVGAATCEVGVCVSETTATVSISNVSESEISESEGGAS